MDILREDDERIRASYESVRPRYVRLAINLQQALSGFLEDGGIPFLSIQYRIKDFASCHEKIRRKNYANTLEDIEDLCGLRVICYYPSDVEHIGSLIRDEFRIIRDEDTATRLAISEFGYRSYHFVVGVKEQWLSAPNYRGLGDLKAEVQVRTVLMHAWAEIEHKLAYKSEQQVPDPFKRRLSRLSAKFEEADEQFEELRQGLVSYRSELRLAAENSGRFNPEIELNLDTLQAYLDYHFPHRLRSINATRELLEELTRHDITMNDLVSGWEQVKNWIPQVEKDAKTGLDPEIYPGEYVWAQVGVVRVLLDFTHDAYYNSRSAWLKSHGGGEETWVSEWRRRISEE